MIITGLHHVTAITANAPENLRFYTEVLGLRLVKKTVNQDDVSAYHLFYADKLGTPGTDLTFFDWPTIGAKQPGTDTIGATFFRVQGATALDYWQQRLNDHHVSCMPIQRYGSTSMVRFVDPEGQELALIDDGGIPFDGQAWEGGGVPDEHALRGLYAVRLEVPSRELLEFPLLRILGWKKLNEFADVYYPDAKVSVYGMDGGGPGREVHVTERLGAPAWNSAGNVHHVAFRVKDKEALHAWHRRLEEAAIGNSGLIDRFYFTSLYFRVTPGILFELATDGPGFATDEPADKLGQRLSLPPFLESQRPQIEKGLQDL
jgi:glyoxalase family protein